MHYSEKKVGKYILRKDEFTFMFKLFNNEEIDIKLKFKTKNPQIFSNYIDVNIFNYQFLILEFLEQYQLKEVEKLQ